MSTPLRLDFNNASAAQVGDKGLVRADLDGLAPRVAEAHRWLSAARASGEVAFLDLPFDLASAQAAKAMGRELASFENVLVLGIGGSSLGAKALVCALGHPFRNLLPAHRRGGPRLFFPDNADARTFRSLLELVDLSSSAVVAITKSGGTAETWAQLLVLRERLGSAAVRQIIAVTDPGQGALRHVADAERWRSLPVPPAVGGRFSVFTAVGLLPAAAAGIDVDELLAGARAMVRRCECGELFENPAYWLAAALYWFDTQRGRSVHVLMPYADALRELADWFVQLWAESLGKRRGSEHVGPTPLAAVGATDQHSLLQLLMEGPDDKLTLFVAVERQREDLAIPAAFTNLSEVAYLGGHTFHDLLSAEQRATAAALAAKGRPSITISLPELTPFAVGELLMLFEVATAIAGRLYGVNPFDQPGVEAGKRYACGLLGRAGYEKERRELEARGAPSESWRI